MLLLTLRGGWGVEGPSHGPCDSGGGRIGGIRYRATPAGGVYLRRSPPTPAFFTLINRPSSRRMPAWIERTAMRSRAAWTRTRRPLAPAWMATHAPFLVV
jgi:hypothetical protein